LSPSIYYLRTSFQNFTSAITFKKEDINDISLFFDEFEALFNDKIAELFDKDIPFTQTDNAKNCEYCPFRSLCER
ncbi:MAG: PD-(D/E)XK nuclease family protein, partial [Dysgonamonadaceae bacterium]|nr:PD-(D/E)XK nuclease family protein [Dysgonamonadaceae bacterium]